jgi:hypothetical protein
VRQTLSARNTGNSPHCRSAEPCQFSSKLPSLKIGACILVVAARLAIDARCIGWRVGSHLFVFIDNSDHVGTLLLFALAAPAALKALTKPAELANRMLRIAFLKIVFAHEWAWR